MTNTGGEEGTEVSTEIGEAVDLLEIAGQQDGESDAERYQNVVDMHDYAEMMAEHEKKRAAARRRAKQEGGAAGARGREPEDQVSDGELAARLMRSVEFDENAAIERVKNKKWLIDGIIPHGDVGFIYGRPGSYKSFMAVDIASHVASATAWNGIDVDLPGGVLYIAGEGGSQLHVRKKAWRIARGGDNDAMTILERGVMINNATERAELKALIREVERIKQIKHVLIVIDTFSKCFSGDENSSEDMRSFIAGCEDLRDTFDGCSVLFVGHTGKSDPNSMRGSSAAMADCGFSYRVTRGQRKLYAEMHCDKMKDAIEPEDMAFQFDISETGDRTPKGAPMNSLVPRMTAILERQDDEASDKPGRAEAFPKSTAGETNKMKLVGMLKNRIRLNGGRPVNRMVIRDDMMTMFLHSEGMKEGAAKMAWRRVWDLAVQDGTIVVCDGDQWLLKDGV